MKTDKMTHQNIKEQIGVFWFCLLASRMGCKVKWSNVSDGTDIEIEQTVSYHRKGKERHFSLGRSVEVQLKTTTKKHTIKDDQGFKFDLESKNYDDLIFRKNNRLVEGNETNPLILVVVVLPEEKEEWIKIYKDEGLTLLGGTMFWFYPEVNDGFTNNIVSKRIHIPSENQLDLDFFLKIFSLPFKSIA
jgi:Domain of unknown function (DUF4365)